MFPSPGVEPGPCGWEPQILTARPTGTVHSWILNSDALVVCLFCYIAVDFQLIKGLAGLQNFSQSGSRTLDLRVRSANPNLVYQQTLLPFKIFPSPGVEPGPCGWKPQILTARPTGTVHSSILNSDALVGRLFGCIAVDFQLIKYFAGLQNFSQSGSRTRDLRVGLAGEVSKS